MTKPFRISQEPWAFWQEMPRSVFDAPHSYVSFATSAINASYLAELEQRFSEIAQLVENWDGYGGAAVSSSALHHAKAIIESQLRYCSSLPLPEVTPTSSGTIAMEWQGGLGEAIVELGKTRLSGFIQPPETQKVLVAGKSEDISEHLPTLIDTVLNASTALSEPVTRIEYAATGDE